jgi:galactose mutarotase-like enzyme
VLLTSGEAAIVIDLNAGGRLVSWTLAGVELLALDDVDGVPPSVTRGCYAMAPWAGRLAGGTFEHEGEVFCVNADLGGHAIHGDVKDCTAQLIKSDGRSATLLLPSSAPGPLSGTAFLQYGLMADRLSMHLTWVSASASDVVVSLGFHPWFRRHLPGIGDIGLVVAPQVMVERGPTGLPTGRLVAPTPGPWDDCFTGLSSDPVLRWGPLTLTLSSSAPWWVVFDELPHAVCVEPQTQPPDVLHHRQLATRPVAHDITFSCRWSLNDAA